MTVNSIVSIDLTKLTVADHWKEHLGGLSTLFLNSDIPSNVAISILTGEVTTPGEYHTRSLFLSILETRLSTTPEWANDPQNIMAIAGAIASPPKHKISPSQVQRSGSSEKIYARD